MKSQTKYALGTISALGFSALTTLSAQAACKMTIKCSDSSRNTIQAVDWSAPTTGQSTLPPLSSYFPHQKAIKHSASSHASARASSYVLPGGYASSSSRATTTATGSGFGSALASARATTGSASSLASARSASGASARAASRSTASGSSAKSSAHAAAKAKSYSRLSAPIVSSRSSASAYATSSASTSYSSARSFSGATSTAPGLSVGERLISTPCPQTYSRVSTGCYNVATYVPSVQQYRVIRPIIYVRYPVPVPVTYPACPYYVGGSTCPTHGRSRYGH